jgi:hypothetical protein
MSHSTVRLGNGELDAVTELHRVNLSPENRFEASPLRGNSTATGTFRRHLGVLVRNGRDHSMGIVGVVLVGIVRVANRLRILSAQARTTCAWMADLARIAPVYRDAALIACHYVGVGLASRMALARSTPRSPSLSEHERHFALH